MTTILNDLHKISSAIQGILRISNLPMALNLRRTDIIFIRHGESANNVTYELVLNQFNEDLTPEQYEIELGKLHNPDCALSERGHKQIEILKDAISGGCMSRIISNPEEWKLFSSPMNRCLITSNEIAEGFKKRGTVIPFLYESDGCYARLDNHGTRGLPGMTAAEVHEKFANLDCAPGMENGWYHLAYKETHRQFLERADTVADWLWKLHDQSTEERGFKTGCVISAHGNLIQAVISSLVGSPNMMLTHDNTGYAHVQLYTDMDTGKRIPAIIFTNKTDHLREYPELISGGAVVEGHWIQEYLEPMDE